MGRRGSSVNADARARAWDLHLQGRSFAEIGRALGLDRKTVSGVIREMYGELEREQIESQVWALEEAVARVRLIERQAWADHDADGRREAAAVSLGLAREDEPVKECGAGRKLKREWRVSSQRAQYLRVILDCEREVARLRGLYRAPVAVDEGTHVVFRIERVEPGKPAGATPADTG